MKHRIIIRPNEVKIISDDPTVFQDAVEISEARRFASVEMIKTDRGVKWVVIKDQQKYGPFETKQEALRFEMALPTNE